MSVYDELENMQSQLDRMDYYREEGQLTPRQEVDYNNLQMQYQDLIARECNEPSPADQANIHESK